MSITLDDVVALYERWGTHNYDEELSQLAHAEQTAALAVAAGADEAIVLAALLHDLGHLLYLDGTATGPHETTGPAYLGELFGDDINSPIALHVEAKRYLCATDSAYYASLSEGSKRSLTRQGGPLDANGMSAFEAQTAADAAIALRRWDDGGKVDGLAVAPFTDYVPLLTRHALL
ncbi:MAG: hypothetical protein Q8K63_10975 [Acidimicrobiales bacterium]|nr:hypothetical protein [Acidimicrobiales bacterium]